MPCKNFRFKLGSRSCKCMIGKAKSGVTRRTKVITQLQYEGQNIFVDCLTHFNHLPLLQRTLQQMEA